MAKLLKLRRGTTSQHSSFTGAEGEVTIDTDKDVPVVHDGSTTGGRALAREDMSNVSSASIAGRLSNDSIATSKIAAGALPSDVTVTNANVVSNAAIAGTKVSPDFGSQNISTTGTIGSSNITITNTQPFISLQDSDNENDFEVGNAGGTFRVRDVDAGVNRLTINSSGTAGFSGNLDVGAGIDVTGNITVTGTVDGVDIAAFKQEFDNAFPAGTRMIFQQTSAPTGWTKVTTGVNNHALRVVSGTAGSGGNVAFSSAFATRGINATAGNTTAGGNVSSSAGNTTAGGNVSVSVANAAQGGNVSIGNTAQGGNVSIGNTSTGGNVNSHTLSINQIPAHSHSMTFNRGSQRARNQRTAINGMNYGSARDGGAGNANTNNNGGNGGHSHGFSGSSHNHNASFSGSNHNHNASFSGSNHSHSANGSFSGSAHNHNVSSSFSGSAHNHSISVGNLDMNVEYLDVIIASKD